MRTSFLFLALVTACGDSDPGPSSSPLPAPSMAQKASKPTLEAKPSPVARGPLQALYLELRNGGCDPSGIDSPMVARALRNTPFALAGRPFQSSDLDALYRADGGWYHPRGDDADIVLDDKDQACVDAIKAHEDVLRKQVCLDAETQAALTSDHELLLWLVRHGQHGLIEGRMSEPWTDPGFDVCNADREALLSNAPWYLSRWEIEVATPRTVEAGLKALEMPEGIGLAGGPELTKADIAAQRGKLRRWLQAGTVRSLDVEVLSQDRPDEHESYEGQVVRRCVGPGDFLSSDWICLGYSLP